MGNKTVKKLEINSVNRIKYEKREQFEASLFADAYAKAAKLTSAIVEANLTIDESEIVDENFCTEERFNNIISFWGERGMGKSSAMLSFALFLKKYEADIQDRFWLNTSRQPKFYVLPRIDAAMLVKGESLLDIILAKMWSSFEKKAETAVSPDDKLKEKETKGRFGDVRKSFDLYRKGASGKIDDSMTSVRQLKELSKCLNLREDFKRLVNSYLSYMTDTSDQIKFLVITIDDLDVAVEDVNSILEQIRLFLMIPQVIVLATADYERIYLDCNKSFSQKLIYPFNIQEHEKEMIRGYTKKYLDKIFPANMRVHMPGINGVGRVEYDVDMPEFAEKQNSRNDIWDEKKALFLMLAKYTKIMLNPFGSQRHFLQKHSLRTIVNELYELNSMNGLEEEERYTTACSWLQTALIDYSREVTDSAYYSKVQTILTGDSKSINEVIIKVVKEDLGIWGDIDMPEEYDGSYGLILNLLFEEEENVNPFAHFIMVLYSTVAAEVFRSKENGANPEVLGLKYIFSPAIEAQDISQPEQKEIDKMPADDWIMHLSIPKNSDNFIVQCVKENAETIYKIFSLTHVGKLNLWNQADESYLKYKADEEVEEAPGEIPEGFGGDRKEQNDSNGIDVEYHKPQDSKRIKLHLTTSDDHIYASIDSLLWSALTYEERLKGFCTNIYDAIYEKYPDRCGELSDEAKEKAIEEIMSIELFKKSIYQEWKEQSKIKGINSLLPCESVEVMVHLAQSVSKVNPIGKVNSSSEEKLSSERVLGTLKLQMDCLIEELRRIESYYSPIMKESLYSEKLTSMMNMLEPYEITGELTNPKETGQSIPPTTAM